MKLALDTSAYSHLRANHPKVIDAVAKAEVVFLPAIVLGELHAAFAMGRRASENRVALEEFLAEPFCQVINADIDVARRYGQLFVELRKAGTPVPINDMWIAASALESGARLLTFDRDFAHFRTLECTILSQTKL